MLLSIGMIVKNEEKYLRDCLTALKPILDNVDSELIIVDTGSTDKTVEIAREFTDNVLFFEWIKDFAAARNHGLKAAKGEWFMSVDADEIFQSCDDIIRFFNSGEYKNYNSALFSVRNYVDIEKKDISGDVFVPRLTKILPETKYEGIVHERFNTFGEPEKLLLDIADHYGYLFVSDKELQNQKFERNKELLLLKLEKEPDNPVIYKELYDTFSASNVETQAIEYAYKGIELCKKYNTDYIYAFYHVLIFSSFNRNKYDEVLKLYDEYFDVPQEIRFGDRSTDIEVYGYTGLALCEQKKYSEAYDMLKKCRERYAKEKREGTITREALWICRQFNNSKAIANVNLFYTECCLQTKRYKEAEDNFKQNPIENFFYNNSIKIMRLNQLIDLMIKLGGKSIDSIYNNLDDDSKKLFIDAARCRIMGFEDNDRRLMINKLLEMNINADSRQFITITKAHFTGNGAGSERIASFVEKHGAHYPELLYIMLDEKLDISPYITECLDISADIMQGIANIPDYIDKVKAYRPEYLNDVNGILSLTEIYIHTITAGYLKNVDVSDMIVYLGNCGMMYLQNFGENDIPESILAAVTIEEVNIYRRRKDYKSCIAGLRRLIQLDKRYGTIAKAYQQIIKDDMAET